MIHSISEAITYSRTLPWDSARLDVELLLCHCLAKPRSYLRAWPQQQLNAAQAHLFNQLLERRTLGEPMAYVLGEREFWSLPLKVGPATLIPRPETELIVEAALELGPIHPCRVLDLGTGTGAIALALARERPQWQLTATDRSPEALELASYNSKKLNLPVELIESNWFSHVGGQFAVIISNPPYIDPSDEHLQQGDVRYEPRSALVAEGNGLRDLLTIIQQAPDFLLPGGWLLLEHGWQQGEAVVDALTERGFSEAHCRKDLSGQPRISLGRWPEPNQ